MTIAHDTPAQLRAQQQAAVFNLATGRSLENFATLSGQDVDQNENIFHWRELSRWDEALCTEGSG